MLKKIIYTTHKTFSKYLLGTFYNLTKCKPVLYVNVYAFEIVYNYYTNYFYKVFITNHYKRNYQCVGFI